MEVFGSGIRIYDIAICKVGFLSLPVLTDDNEEFNIIITYLCSTRVVLARSLFDSREFRFDSTRLESVHSSRFG